MSKFNSRTLPAILLSSLLSFSLSAGACSLRVGWEPWFPFIYREYDSFQGPEYQLLERLASEAGCQLEYIERPWLRALHELSQGQLDMLYGASHTAEREAFAQFSTPYRVEQFHLIVAAHAPVFTSLSHWLEYQPAQRFGLIRGFYYGSVLDPLLRDASLAQRRTEVGSDAQLLELLRIGRIDGYWVEALVADSKMLQGGLQMLALPDVAGEPMHLMFGRQVPLHTVQRFNQAIAQELLQGDNPQAFPQPSP